MSNKQTKLPANKSNNIINIIESALAAAGYEIIHSDKDSIMIKHKKSNLYREIKIIENDYEYVGLI